MSETECLIWVNDYVELQRKAEQSLIWKPIKQFMKWRHGSYFTMVDTYNWRWRLRSITWRRLSGCRPGPQRGAHSPVPG
jgi:hypothetical protein